MEGEGKKKKKDNAGTSKRSLPKILLDGGVSSVGSKSPAPDQTVHRSPSLKFTFKREPNELYSLLKAKGGEGERDPR